MSSANKLVPLVMSRVPAVKDQMILDVACGYGKWGYLIKIDKILFRTMGEGSTLIGCDIFLPYLKFVKRHSVYDDVIQCDVAHLPIRNRMFDTVLALELIEHLPKHVVAKLFRELERVCRKRVILSTPNRYSSQEEIHNNPYEVHRSSHNAKEFKRHGYRVYGVGVKYIGRLGAFLNLSRFLPILAELLVAWKDITSED